MVAYPTQITESAQRTKNYKTQSTRGCCSDEAAIRLIKAAEKNTANIKSCLLGIKTINPYLSHPSKQVRKAATEAMSKLIQRAIELLSQEKDLKVVKESCEELSKIVCGLELNQTGSQGVNSVFQRVLQKMVSYTKNLRRNNDNPFYNNDFNHPGARAQNHINFNRLIAVG